MKAYFLMPGESEGAFERREVPRPEVKGEQVLVKVHAAGLNRGELFARSMFLKSNLAMKPMPGGIDFAGEIAEVGPDATGWQVGERVMGAAMGSYADYVVAYSAFLIRIPDSMTFEEAAGVPNTFVTAHDALASAGRLVAGETVMITAAASAIGTAAMALARHMGAGSIIATTRTVEKVARLKQAGADHVLLTTDSSWVEEVQRLTDARGVDVIADSVGGPLLEDNLKALAVRGRLVNVGRNGGAPGALDMDMLAFKRAVVVGTTQRTRTPQESFRAFEKFVTGCADGLASGALRPVIDRVFPFEELAKAHEYMLADQQVGRLILKI